VLNHTAGLQNALDNLRKENPFLLTDWDECLKQIAMSAPETEPGQVQLYHFLSFGWLCGGIIEVQSHAQVFEYERITKLTSASVFGGIFDLFSILMMCLNETACFWEEISGDP
jgi:hypothetical protein